MEPIESPFNNGQLPRPGSRWRHFIPGLGPSWRDYRAAVIAQATARGEVPPEVWSGASRHAIAQKLQRRLCEAWGIDLSFHPEDPWLVIGEWEAGDLSEVEVLMCTRTNLGVRSQRTLARRLSKASPSDRWRIT